MLRALVKIPIHRTQEDIRIIKAHLKTIPFLVGQFQEDEDSFDQLSKCLRVEVFVPDDIVFKIGEQASTPLSHNALSLSSGTQGEKYYLILKGAIELFIRTPK